MMCGYGRAGRGEQKCVFQPHFGGHTTADSIHRVIFKVVRGVFVFWSLAL